MTQQEQKANNNTKHWDEQIASYWSNVIEKGGFANAVYWLGNPIVNRFYQSKAVGGRTYPHWINFCVDYYLGNRCPADRILSVGCGDGDLERHLASLNAFKALDGIDIAPGRIQVARQKAKEQGITGIRYFARNIEKMDFPEKDYDAIFYNMSLHHMFQMEHIICKTVNALKPDGFLFVHEYIGPNHFGFSAREQEAIQALHALIPEKYRYSLAQHNFGHLQTKVQLPSPSEVASVDPSEAVCSEEILPMLEKHCDIVEFNKIGGTALQFLLQNIVGHFREEDPDSMMVLNLILKAEEVLIDIGDLPSHFALIVAKVKST